MPFGAAPIQADVATNGGTVRVHRNHSCEHVAAPTLPWFAPWAPKQGSFTLTTRTRSHSVSLISSRRSWNWSGLTWRVIRTSFTQSVSLEWLGTRLRDAASVLVARASACR